MLRQYVNDAVDQAIVTLLRSEVDDDGNPLSDNHSPHDVFISIWMEFGSYIAAMLEDDRSWSIAKEKFSAKDFGHFFILSAKGYGSGFFSDDGGWGEDSLYLHDRAMTFGAPEVSIGLDGKIYI